MADFLLELRCEEIPARMQAGARAELEKLFRRELDAAGVAAGGLTIWSTPRRLALIARGLPLATEAVSEEAKGPPEGAPDAAIDGFCKKAGVTREALELREVKGRMTYFAVVNTPGRPMAEVLSQAIPAIIRDFSWPKSMRWGAASITTDSLRWVRPLSGIIALLDGEVVPCAVDGIAAGRETYGHRFHSAGAITIGSADDYAEKLRAAHVIVDHEERACVIRDGARAAAAEAGLVLVEDEGLVIENAGLTEWPVPLLGRFDEAFLDVPPEVIQLTARVNQKYFVCQDASGKLANAFVCTANIAARDPAVVVDGNRKVLAARLSDARFFWEQDQKTPLAEHAKKLARITFHEKLGTVADKVERVAKLARWLVESDVVTPAQAGASGGSAQTFEMPASAGMTKERLAVLAFEAARLCKADLVTEMVGEFPELQGLMGGYYAAKEGLPVEVAEAIRDHYKPVGQGDDVPTAPVTVAVSLADKLDTLFSFFAIDEGPTGSRDPYALRRQTIAILSLVFANKLRLPLMRTFEALAVIFHEQYVQAMAWEIPNLQEKAPSFIASLPMRDADAFKALDNLVQAEKDAYLRSLPEFASDAENPDTRLNQERRLGAMFRAYAGSHRWFADWEDVQSALARLISFAGDRLKVQQREAGVRHDLIDAVFALGGEDDLVRLLARVHALQAFITTEDGANLLAGYKRAANILKKEGFVSGEVEAALTYTPEPAEAALIDALDAAAPRAAEAVAAEDFAAAMAALATLRGPIDRFFEDVTVNAEEAEKRSRRLALLARFRDAVHRVADFSRIEG